MRSKYWSRRPSHHSACFSSVETVVASSDTRVPTPFPVGERPALAGPGFPGASGLSRRDRKAGVRKPAVQLVREEKSKLRSAELALASLLHFPKSLVALRTRHDGPSPPETGAVRIGEETILALVTSVRPFWDFQKTLGHGFLAKVVERFGIRPHSVAADRQRKARSVCPRQQMEIVGDVPGSSLLPDTCRRSFV